MPPYDVRGLALKQALSFRVLGLEQDVDVTWVSSHPIFRHGRERGGIARSLRYTSLFGSLPVVLRWSAVGRGLDLLVVVVENLVGPAAARFAAKEREGVGRCRNVDFAGFEGFGDPGHVRQGVGMLGTEPDRVHDLIYLYAPRLSDPRSENISQKALDRGSDQGVAECHVQMTRRDGGDVSKRGGGGWIDETGNDHTDQSGEDGVPHVRSTASGQVEI